jgi:hypothetical protein
MAPLQPPASPFFGQKPSKPGNCVKGLHLGACGAKTPVSDTITGKKRIFGLRRSY